MVMNKVGKDIPQVYADQYGVFEGELAHIDTYQEASRTVTPLFVQEIPNFLAVFARRSKRQG